MSYEQNYDELLKENAQLFKENKKNKYNKKDNNLDKFNAMIDEATQAIICDSTCQKERKNNELKQKYLDAQSNLARGPDILYNARKNFVIYNEGQPVYDELIEAELTKKADMIASFYEENFKSESKNVLFDIKTYSGLLMNLKNVFELYLKYKQENVELSKKLKDESNDILTNERKTYYQDQGIDNLQFYYFYFLITVYIVCVVGFGLLNFIYPSQFEFKIRIIVFILLLILPFISTWLLGKLILIIYSIYGLLPKNVHKTF
jgi:hypothetical protein